MHAIKGAGDSLLFRDSLGVVIGAEKGVQLTD